MIYFTLFTLLTAASIAFLYLANRRDKKNLKIFIIKKSFLRRLWQLLKFIKVSNQLLEDIRTSKITSTQSNEIKIYLPILFDLINYGERLLSQQSFLTKYFLFKWEHKLANQILRLHIQYSVLKALPALTLSGATYQQSHYQNQTTGVV